jgi:hypothetical protein
MIIRSPEYYNNVVLSKKIMEDARLTVEDVGTYALIEAGILEIEEIKDFEVIKKLIMVGYLQKVKE